MRYQRGMSFISIVLLVALLVTIILIGVKLVPAYIEFFSVKKVLATMAKDPGFPTMSARDIIASFDRRATIDYITVVEGKDLDISKQDGENVVSVEYSQKIPLAFNISACLDFSASTASGSSATKSGE
jgi:hypothetical protein